MIKKIVASLLLLLIAFQVCAVNPDDLLRPDDAFKPTLSIISNDRIKATWDIADEYYMYRKRFKFTSDTQGITLGEAVIPKGKIKDDPGFGRVETYRKQVAIEIPLIFDNTIRDASAYGALELAIKTVSQGCADAGICYPPQRKTLTIKLDAIKVAAPAAMSAPIKDKKEEKTNLADTLGLSGLMSGNQPLPPEEAFNVKLNTTDGQLLKANWNVTKGHYLYQDKIKLRIVEPKNGLTVGDLDLPPAVLEIDPFFGEMNTYNKDFSISAKIDGDVNLLSQDIMVKATYQGCSKLTGICYPPQHDTLKVNFSSGQLIKVAATSSPKDTTAIDASPKKEERISMADELGLSGIIGSNAPLPPEEAFNVKLDTDDGQLLKANWNITKGHYLYQDKLKLKIITPRKGLTISDLDLPPSVKEIDPFFGEMNTYNKNFSVTAKIDGDVDLLSQDIMVKATYQGCSKLTGICYPPQHDTIKVNFSSGQLIKVAAATATEDTVTFSAAPAMDSAPAMDAVPLGQQKPSLMSGFTGSNTGVSSSPVSSSPALGTPDLASQLGLSGLSTGDEVLDPDQAFVFDITASDKQTLNARWDIVKGHYLYQHMFKFSVLDKDSGVTLGKAKLPKGKEEFDQYFGDVVIYYDSFDAKVPVVYNGADKVDSITVKTTYQGCSKLTGICYPPQHKTQTINLAMAQDVAVASVAANDSNSDTKASTENTDTKNAEAVAQQSVSKVSDSIDPNAKVSEQDGLMNKLLTGGFFNSLLIFFLAGLALTFTPCVFPMIPILSGIIAGQGSDNSTKKSFFLSLSYVLAMAVTYAIVGVIAALSGENLQVALQNPWVIGSFAVLFVLLSLSMFGFYELQMPASIQSKLTKMSNSQNGGSMANAGVMGFLSALIVGPCVTAPLIAALVYIANTKDVVLGGMSLFALGLGMGLPLLIIGTSAGKILPKAGAWMDSVKAGFGIMMLAMGIWMLERILPFEFIVVLVGILVVFTGIYMGALDALNEASTGWKRFFKASGLVVLIYGVTLLIGAASGNASLLKPLKGFGGGVAQTSAEPQHLVFKQIKGIQGLEDALALAKQSNQAVMLDFYADWCISCKEMEHLTFTDKKVVESLKDTLLIQADVTLDDELDKALNKRFGLFGPPAILFFDKESKEKKPYRIVGFKGAKDFNDHVQQFKQTLK